MFSSDEYLEKQKTSTAKGVGGDCEDKISDHKAFVHPLKRKIVLKRVTKKCL